VYHGWSRSFWVFVLLDREASVQNHVIVGCIPFLENTWATLAVGCDLCIIGRVCFAAVGFFILFLFFHICEALMMGICNFAFNNGHFFSHFFIRYTN
jgi:hypothetical protein